MTSFSSSIKELNKLVENLDIVQIEVNAKSAIKGADGAKLKFICDNKNLIFKMIDVAEIFTGPKGDKVLDTLKEVIKTLCPDTI